MYPVMWLDILRELQLVRSDSDLHRLDHYRELLLLHSVVQKPPAMGVRHEQLAMPGTVLPFGSTDTLPRVQQVYSLDCLLPMLQEHELSTAVAMNHQYLFITIKPILTIYELSYKLSILEPPFLHQAPSRME